MEKVKLSKEQIKMFENHKGSAIKMLLEKYTDKNRPTYIDELSLKEVVECILGNYELEETPEEKLLKEFDWIREQSTSMDLFRSARYGGMFEGVLLTLDALDIKIKGINE